MWADYYHLKHMEMNQQVVECLENKSILAKTIGMNMDGLISSVGPGIHHLAIDLQDPEKVLGLEEAIIGVNKALKDEARRVGYDECDLRHLKMPNGHHTAKKLAKFITALDTYLQTPEGQQNYYMTMV